MDKSTCSCGYVIRRIMDPKNGEIIYFDPATGMRIWLCPECCLELSDRVFVRKAMEV